MKNRTVDVLIAAYNEAGIIARTIQSIAVQTVDKDTTFTIHIVANGCADETVAIAERTISKLTKHPNLNFYIHNLEHANKVMALNYALRRSDAPLIFSIDADSVLSNECFNKTLELFADPQTMVAGPLPQIQIGKRHCNALLGQMQRITNIRQYYEATTPAGCMIAFRRELADSYPEPVAADDTWLAFAAAHRYGWQSIKITREAVVRIVGPQQWIDYLTQESRFSRATKQLLETFPEFTAVRAEQAKMVAQITKKNLQAIKLHLKRERIHPTFLKYHTFFQKLCEENALLMAHQLVNAEGRWEAILSTKQTPDEIC